MQFTFTILIGMVIGVVACLPPPRKNTPGFIASTVFGILGSIAGLEASVAMGVDTVGPWAQAFISMTAATTAVAVYQMATSETPTLR